MECLSRFVQGCNAPLGMESRKIKDSQIKSSTFGTSGMNMRAAHARLNSNGGWCVKKVLNYKTGGKEFHIPNEYLGKLRSVGIYITEV